MTQKFEQNRLHLAFINIAAVTALIGIVALVSQYLDQIPGMAWVLFFSIITLVFVGIGYSYLSKDNQFSEKQTVGRIWFFWAGLAYGIAVVSGGHFFELLDFIPDLVLAWLVGLLLLGIWSGNRWQMSLAAVLNIVWMSLVFLYDQSYIPGALIVAVIYWFVFYRRQATAAFTLNVVATIALANLYFYDYVNDFHYPLTYSFYHLIFTVALLASVAGLSGLKIRGPLWKEYSGSLHLVSAFAGAAIALALVVRENWSTLIYAYDGNLRGPFLSFVILQIAIIAVLSMKTRIGRRASFYGWCAGFLMLAAGMLGLPDAMTTFLPLAASGFGLLLAISWLYRGVHQLSLMWVISGLALTTATLVVTMLEWTDHFAYSVFIPIGIGALIYFVGMSYRYRLNQLDEPQNEDDPPHNQHEQAASPLPQQTSRHQGTLI